MEHNEEFEQNLENAADNIAQQGVDAAQDAVQQGEQAVEQTVDGAKDAAQQVADQAGDAVNEVADDVDDATGEFKAVENQGAEAAFDAAQDVENAADNAAEDVENAAEDVENAADNAAETAEQGSAELFENAQNAGEQAAADVEGAAADAEQTVQNDGFDFWNAHKADDAALAEQTSDDATQVIDGVENAADQAASDAEGTAADAEQTIVQAPIAAEAAAENAADSAKEEDPFAALASVSDDESQPKKKHRKWPWVTLGVILLALAGCAGGVAFFHGVGPIQAHALPGVSLWGNSVMGKSKQDIVNDITKQVEDTKVSTSYNDKSASFSLSQLGVNVDAEKIADQVLSTKRSHWWDPTQYAFWNKTDVNPEVDTSTAKTEVIDKALGIDTVDPVDAQVKLNDDKTAFETVAATKGKGADVSAVAKQALVSLTSFGKTQPENVTITTKEVEPTITDEIANSAKDTLNKLVESKVGITINDHTIATFDAPALAAAMTIDPNESTTLEKGQARNGYVVFDAAKLQKYYESDMKPNLKTDREDREVIVNSVGDELQVNKEGHDGVTVADGADTNIGTQAVDLLAKGSGNVAVKGKVDPMKTTTTKRTVVVDLSDHYVYAYENDKLVMSLPMTAGQGNNYATGECTGDLCTPTYCDPNVYDNCTKDGDFKVWAKYPSQDMSGTLTLSNGSTEKWDVKNVGYVNYFSKTGCAIHRIATDYVFNSSSFPIGRNTSHGCVGVGWDQAAAFYNWCLMGTTVHVQA